MPMIETVQMNTGTGARCQLPTDHRVETSTLTGSDDGPLVIKALDATLGLKEWAAEIREPLERELTRCGAVLFRGFHVPGAEAFRSFAGALADQLIDYSERAAPRKMIRPGVYTSTEFPATQYIPLHHEMSYSNQWPRKIWFYCSQPSLTGGCTPIADDRRIFRALRPELKQKFIEKGLMYVRNFGQGVDMSWQDAFQTSDKSVVERYGAENGIEIEWHSGDRLRTRQRRQVVAVHPVTGETVWFNHAHMFHWSSLDVATRKLLLELFPEDELPRNVAFGDGSPLDVDDLDEIRRTQDEAAIRFVWTRGDVLMLDNMLMVHGRDPFEGPRTILVAMADIHRP